MQYQGYLIGNFATGYDKELQPWLIPDDAQDQLLDGFVYKGVWQKRDGYNQYADGARGGAPYCESRMIHTITINANQVPNGIITVFTFNIPGSANPLRRGGFRAIDKTALGVQSQIIQDNGVGGTLAGSDGTIDTTLNYTTTLATPQQVTFTVAPPIGHTVTLELDIHQGFPVMGVMNFFTQTNTRELIVADTTYVNRYNATTNRLDDISPTTLLTGTNVNFMSWVNYPDPQDRQRLLFVNFKDPIQQYNGTTVTPYPVYTASLQITNTPSGVLGNGTTGPYVISTPANTGIFPGSLSVIDVTGVQTITFDQFGVASGAGTGTVNFLTGQISVTFNVAVGVGNAINLTYLQQNTPITTALHIFQFKDRLVVLYTQEGGVQYGHRIRISGTGAFGDVFTSNAIGAGVIDIPADPFISSADFNRDDLLIFLRGEAWSMRFTQNDVTPFVIDRIDGTRGSDAPYGTITYLNATNAVSNIGFIISDGYSIERSDLKIPDYSYNEINQEQFGLCFAGSVDQDRDHYLIHPTPQSNISDRILISNYEEGNYAIYRIPLSCMGNYIESKTITWNDLLKYNTWAEMATDYGSWNAFGFAKDNPITIGGGHEGQIVRLNNVETEDYPVKIRNMTVIDSETLRVTTDFTNYEIGDVIILEAVTGMVQATQKQAAIVAKPSAYVFDLDIDTTGFSSFTPATDSGLASKVIIFDCKTKKFNPFANQDKKVSCGWVYFYVSSSGTDITTNRNITAATQTNPCVLTVPGHGYTSGTLIYINGVQGMTQLNDLNTFITVINQNTISLDQVDSTAFSAYTSSGFTSTSVDGILKVYCISNDTEQPISVEPFNPSPFQVNLSSQYASNGIKKWYKLWINQTARFIQLQVVNDQAGVNMEIHAIMPGFAGIGRLI